MNWWAFFFCSSLYLFITKQWYCICFHKCDSTIVKRWLWFWKMILNWIPNGCYFESFGLLIVEGIGVRNYAHFSMDHNLRHLVIYFDLVPYSTWATMILLSVFCAFCIVSSFLNLVLIWQLYSMFLLVINTVYSNQVFLVNSYMMSTLNCSVTKISILLRKKKKDVA